MRQASGRTGWSHFAHGADIGVQGRGPNLAGAFEQAALALTAVITDPALVAPNRPIEIHCTAPDRELLLVDWLNALIYEMATRGMLFGRYRVTMEDGNSLIGRAWGEAADTARHHPAAEVKGATYTELSVLRGGNGIWSARCVVDV